MARPERLNNLPPTNWVEMNMPMRYQKKVAEQNEAKWNPLPLPLCILQPNIISSNYQQKGKRIEEDEREIIPNLLGTGNLPTLHATLLLQHQIQTYIPTLLTVINTSNNIEHIG